MVQLRSSGSLIVSVPILKRLDPGALMNTMTFDNPVATEIYVRHEITNSWLEIGNRAFHTTCLRQSHTL